MRSAPLTAAGLSLLFLAGATAAFLHAPHDSIHGLALCRHPSGMEEILVVGEERSVYVSTDGLLTFRLVRGDGVEDTNPSCVTFNPTLPRPGSPEKGCFLIGTVDDGPFAYRPSGDGPLRRARRFDAGLPSDPNQRDVFALASPGADLGTPQPSFFLAATGQVYRLNATLDGWDEVFDTGVANNRAGVLAMAPHFDHSATGAAGTVLAGNLSDLWISTEGGDPGTWSQVPLANPTGDWVLASIAMDPEFGTNPAARIYLGRTRELLNEETEGEILVSTDSGASFVSKLSLNSGVSALASAPAGPSGQPAIFAGPRDFPTTGAYGNTGLMISRDQGETWQDEGNWQNFLQEPDPADGSGNFRVKELNALLVLPDYGTTGRVLWGRHEGLFLSEDEGAVWRAFRVRPTTDVRGVAAAVDAQGHLRHFGATYGAGCSIGDATDGTVQMVEPGMSVMYQRPVAVSPNFQNDGAMFCGGAFGMLGWYDPQIDPPQNPFGVSGVKRLPLREPGTSNNLQEYIRAIAVSPHFDGTGQTGDQVIYFGSWVDRTWYTDDAGETYHEAMTASGGGDLPYFPSYAIAPSFDATQPHSDVYGFTSGAELWRQTDGVWHELADLGSAGKVVVVDPNYDGVTNRRVFLAFEGPEPVVELIDDLGGAPSVQPVADGLPPGLAYALSAASDELGNVWLYCGMWLEGVYRVQVDRGGRWQRVSDAGYPSHWIKSITVSPAWANDRTVFAGTGAGVWYFTDTDAHPFLPGGAHSAFGRRYSGPAGSWQPGYDSEVVDSGEGSVLTFEGPTGIAPDPDLPWPWPTIARQQLPDRGFGPDALYTQVDASRVEVRGKARRIFVHTYAGEDLSGEMGTVTATATDLANGQVLAATTLDLRAQAAEIVPWLLELDLGAAEPVGVQLTLEAALDAGEIFILDAVRFER